MSANYSIIQRPPQWVSAHRECEFKYGIGGTLISSGYDDGDGYLKVNLSGVFPFTPAVGDRVYIKSGTYTGYHVIRSIQSTTQYTFETLWTVDISSSTIIWQVKLPEFRIYKGYASGEIVLPLYPSGTKDLYTIQPRTLAATFRPEFGTDGYISFDISGYLKACLETPYKAGYNETEQSYQYAKSATVDYVPMQYAKVDIMLYENGSETGNLEMTLYVANSALSSEDLNRYHVDTGKPLSPLNMPPDFTHGVNHYDIITGTQINRIKL